MSDGGFFFFTTVREMQVISSFHERCELFSLPQTYSQLISGDPFGKGLLPSMHFTAEFRRIKRAAEGGIGTEGKSMFPPTEQLILARFPGEI